MKNNKFLILALGLLTTLVIAAPVDKFDSITTNSPSKLKVDFLKGINFLSTDSVKLPVGTTAQRDTTPATGMVRVNSTTNIPEIYYASAWRNLLTFTTNLSVPVEMDMTSHKIINLVDPTNPQEAATKAYVDSATAAIDLTNYVDRSTTQTVGGNKTFSGNNTFNNTITGSISGNAATVTTNANLTGEVTSVGNAATLTNSAVIGKTITGFTSGAGTLSGTDSILQAIQKLDGNVAAAGSGTITGPIGVSGGVSSITSQTGTGTKFVVDTSPTLVTPNIGVATATSVNGSVIPTSKTLVVTTDKLNALSSTTSSELAGVISDETGTGSVVFANTPTLVTPVIGAATGTSLALGGTKAASAILDVQSTSQGVLAPRMTTAQMLAISSPATGLTIFNTDVNQTAVYNGTVWTYGFGSLNITTTDKLFTVAIPSSVFGTISPASNQCTYYRVGSYMHGRCAFTSGTVVNSLTSFTVPDSLHIDASKLTVANTTAAAGQHIGNYFGNSGTVQGAIVTATGTSTTTLYFGQIAGSSGNLVPATTSNVATSSQPVSWNFSIPILEWAGSGNSNAWVQANSNPIATTTDFSLQSSSTGVVGTTENVDWVNGNAVVTSTSKYTFTLNSGIAVAQPLNCTATASNAGIALIGRIASSTTSAVVVDWDNYAGGVQAGTFHLKCQRAGADYLAAHSPFIIGIPAMVMASIAPVPTTSGTSIDFNGIPSGVKRITISMSGVSTNGTSLPQIQLGAGAVDTSGYLGRVNDISGSSTSAGSTGVNIASDNGAASLYHGQIVFSSMGSNIWVASGTLSRSDANNQYRTAYSKALSGTLDRIRLTTVNGTDTFDAGNVNVSWEF